MAKRKRKKQLGQSQYTPEQLAADYKARGVDRQAAYSKFIQDMALSPGMDAKEFFKIFDKVTPKQLKRTVGVEAVEPTHIIRYKDKRFTPKKVQITSETDAVVKWVSDIGQTGSDPKEYVKSITPIKKKGKRKTKPLPPGSKDLKFNSTEYGCYGKKTKRGFRVYCRRVKNG
jgi:hypothetical protein